MLANFVRSSINRSSINLVHHFEKLHLSNGCNSFSSFSVNSNPRFGSSCGFLSYAFTNTSHGGELNFGGFSNHEQKRFTKFMPKWKFNWRHKQPRKAVIKPYLKWDFRQLEGKEYTHKPFHLRSLNGRDPETGQRINYHIKEGFKFDWFWIDFRRNRFSPSTSGCYEERILEVRRAPNATAYVALAAGAHGRRWILATENMQAGDVVRSYNYIPKSMLKDYEMPEGDSWPVGALPIGTKVCNVQTKLSSDYFQKDYIVTNAGGSATILRHQGDFTVIGYTKELELAVRRECVATIGRLSNVEHGNLHWGSMNMKRRWGIKQRSGVWHKKDGYCGRKIHPLKSTVLDESKAPPPAIKIPITLTRKDYSGLFGNATTQPSIYIHGNKYDDY